MTFDYFNVSNLAWGKKITQAFKTLSSMQDETDDHFIDITKVLDYYSQYISKNYRCPEPTKGGMPCRINELFNILGTEPSINKFDYVDGHFVVDITYYDTKNFHITHCSGSTTLKQGYAFSKKAVTNINIDKTIRFSTSSSVQSGEELLFQYYINNDGFIFIEGDLSNLNAYPYDSTQYVGIAKGSNISLPYTAQTYECVCLVGGISSINVRLNNKTVLKDNGSALSRNHVILYLKKGDVVSGSVSSAFKIRYLRKNEE